MRKAGLCSLAVLVVALIAAEAAVRIGLVSPFLLAPPSAVARSTMLLFAEDHLLRRFFVTFGMCLAATGGAAVIGVPLGWLLYRRRLLGEAYESWIGALFSAPLILLYPLFLVIFGRNAWTIMVMGFIAGVIPIVLKTREALVGVPRVLVQVGRMFNLSERQVFWKVMFPAATPTIFTGVRLGLIYSLINIVAIEFLIDFGGLGQLVAETHERYDIPGMYGAIVFVIAVSIVFFWLIGRIERWRRLT
jgi:ABC-type nitrate/sulfonate/bicarbonate transport system permease component